jgi:hypothetical protein
MHKHGAARRARLLHERDRARERGEEVAAVLGDIDARVPRAERAVLRGDPVGAEREHGADAVLGREAERARALEAPDEHARHDLVPALPGDRVDERAAGARACACARGG